MLPNNIVEINGDFSRTFENSLPKSFASSQTQTHMLNKSITIVLSNLITYAQQSVNGLVVLASLEQLEMENHAGKLNKKQDDDLSMIIGNDEEKKQKEPKENFLLPTL